MHTHTYRERIQISDTKPIFLQSVVAHRSLPMLYTNVIKQHGHFIANAIAPRIMTVRIKDQRRP